MNLVIYAIPFFMLASGSERVVPGVLVAPAATASIKGCFLRPSIGLA